MTQLQKKRLQSQELAALIGRVTFENLPDTHMEIANAVGIEAALKLCEVFGGCKKYIPCYDAIARIERDREIARKAASGMTAAQLGKRFGMTAVNVRHILRKMADVDLKSGIRVQELPCSLRMFAEIIGVAGTLELCRQIGGPTGEKYYFPSNKLIKITLRNQDIFNQFYRCGKTAAELAEEYRLSDTMISGILRRQRKAL